MQPYFIRSTIFNICFYILTAISCILLLPTLFLPRNIFLGVVTGFCRSVAFLEKYILGLTYEIRGKEHLPQSGAYIIAAKHQSAYETLKLHLLFNDPAVVLKKELLKIPLWGKYLAKSDVIAIDRSSPKLAIQSLKDGARHVAAQNRPIVIFPQGTRVAPETSSKDKPYKIGIVRIQEATALPIIPMALNTGIFYPRQKWCKKPGRVIFEFMPPMMPSDDASNTLKKIETMVEEKTSNLMEEGKQTILAKSGTRKILINLTLFLCCTYMIIWFGVAHFTKKAITDFLNDIAQNPSIIEFQITPPIITGFPGKMHVSLPAQTLKTNAHEKITIDFIRAQSWPIMGVPIDIQTGIISITQSRWAEPLIFDSLDAQIIFKNDILTIKHTTLIAEKTQGYASGQVDFNTSSPYPVINLDLGIENFTPFITKLTQRNIIKKKVAMFVGIALQSLEKNGVVRTTLTSDKHKIYLGPIKVMELPPIKKR